MKKIILFSVFALFTGFAAFAQSNSFGFSKEKMNGEFVQTVSQEDGKTIYAIDLSLITPADARFVFLESIYSAKEVFAVSYPDESGLFFVAGVNSVVNEEQVKDLLLKLKEKSVESTPSQEVKSKLSNTK